MQGGEALRTLLGQARLHVRRAQECMGRTPPQRHVADDECEQACALVDRVMAALRDNESEDAEGEERGGGPGGAVPGESPAPTHAPAPATTEVR